MIQKVMLAAKMEPEEQELYLRGLHYPVLLSPKIDGIRCHVEQAGLTDLVVPLSRKNKIIPNSFIQRVLADKRFLTFDGELTIGKANTNECYNNTQSGVMSQDGEPDFTYHVFDTTRISMRIEPFKVRIKHIYDQVESANKPFIRIVGHSLAYNYEELMAYEEEQVAFGWEGIMIRNLNGPYKQGRSTLREGYLIKLKRFKDSEAEILGAYEQETNTNEPTLNEIGNSKRSSHKAGKFVNGHLGGFHVRDVHTGIEFDLGTFRGITKDERFSIWQTLTENPDRYTGKIIKYKYQPVGVKDRPRQPILTGFRSEDDL